MTSRPLEKINTRSQKPSQRSDYDSNSHNQLFNTPNGRSPSSPINGVGYSNHPFNDSCKENTNSFSSNFQNPEMHGNAT